jgi:hypothetical protein
MDACTPKKGEYNLITVEDYEPLIGAEGVERIGRKAECLRDLHVIAVNSTYYGGGVAQILSSLTLLMNTCGVRTGWRVIQGRPDFFTITKKIKRSITWIGIPNTRALPLRFERKRAQRGAGTDHLRRRFSQRDPNGMHWSRNCRSAVSALREWVPITARAASRPSPTAKVCSSKAGSIYCGCCGRPSPG